MLLHYSSFINFSPNIFQVLIEIYMSIKVLYRIDLKIATMGSITVFAVTLPCPMVSIVLKIACHCDYSSCGNPSLWSWLTEQDIRSIVNSYLKKRFYRYKVDNIGTIILWHVFWNGDTHTHTHTLSGVTYVVLFLILFSKMISYGRGSHRRHRYLTVKHALSFLRVQTGQRKFNYANKT